MSKAWSSPVVVGAALLALVLAVGGAWAWVFAEQGTAPAGATAAAPPSSSSSSTSSPSAAEPTWTMDDARDALAGDGSRVLVLGDSTGNGNDEWASLWAQSAQLPLARWDTDTEAGYVNEADDTRLWSAAMNSGTAGYPLEHDEVWPAQDPDLVLLSYGHFHDSAADATDALEDLRVELADRYPDAPVVVVLQNPEADNADADRRAAIGDWADDAGLPTIDVAAAFEDSGDPDALLADEINPSPEGSQLWADTVAEALG
ncbi:SGNH/GDSL hydrolase family protein [Janibacter sp. G368]|uniref:SGNH/GDSL hydrolase family protein n=1 Tax=Janibacter sp. G368 TaxID=3420441 RepID=UPI003D086A1B